MTVVDSPWSGSRCRRVSGGGSEVQKEVRVVVVVLRTDEIQGKRLMSWNVQRDGIERSTIKDKVV